MKFSLTEQKWYMMECILENGTRHRSPVWITAVTPGKRRQGLLRIGFFNASYSEGVQERAYDLKVVHQDEGYLLALRLNLERTPIATIILDEATFESVHDAFPDSARKVLVDKPVQESLDILTGRLGNQFPRSTGGKRAAPEFVRLPRAGEKCPFTGLSRTTLYNLVVPCRANRFRPAIHAKCLRKRGNIRGIWLIPYDPLVEYLGELPTSNARSDHRSDEEPA